LPNETKNSPDIAIESCISIWEVTPEELYTVAKDHMTDIDAFCEYYREVARHPETFGLEIEK
jgi:hypothetical protein